MKTLSMKYRKNVIYVPIIMQNSDPMIKICFYESTATSPMNEEV